jgi:hypothetical protein
MEQWLAFITVKVALSLLLDSLTSREKTGVNLMYDEVV